MRDLGFKLIYGRWLVEGYPKVILFDIVHAMPQLDGWKKEIWEKSKIGIPWSDRDANEAVVFGFLTAAYLQEFKKALPENSYVVAHFHEWTSGLRRGCKPTFVQFFLKKEKKKRNQVMQKEGGRWKGICWLKFGLMDKSSVGT